MKEQDARQEPHTILKLRIDWSELDLFGHVNNVAFFKYLQSARVNFWDTIGLTAGPDKDGIGPMLAHSACKFSKPLFYPGDIEIKTFVEFSKTSSFGLVHCIYDSQGELAATGNDVMVMYNFYKDHKTPMQDWLRLKLEEFGWQNNGDLRSKG